MITAWNPYGHEHTLDAMNNAIGAEDVLARICCESGNSNDPSKSRKRYGTPYGLIGTMINKHVYACGPKTVPVKRTFLNIAIVGWSGVGWGGMLAFLVLRT